MVANSPDLATALAPFEEPWGEQHFPQGLGDTAPAPVLDPAGMLHQLRSKIEENPWPAVGIALAAGLLIALLSVPRASKSSTCCDGLNSA